MIEGIVQKTCIMDNPRRRKPKKRGPEPKEIKVNKAVILRQISKGNILIFPDREEIVDKIDRNHDNLYTTRTKVNGQWNITEQVRYMGIEHIHPGSGREGQVYNYTKRRIAA